VGYIVQWVREDIKRSIVAPSISIRHENNPYTTNNNQNSVKFVFAVKSSKDSNKRQIVCVTRRAQAVRQNVKFSLYLNN
jgi:hypothetical protein